MFKSQKLYESTLNRFHSSYVVEPNTGCWLWTKSPYAPNSYGFIGIGLELYAAHRVSFFLDNGYLTDGLVVRHKCDTKECVNPKHLLEGTTLDNLNDLISRHGHPMANKTHCVNGHEYDEKNTRIVKFKRNGNIRFQRICRICRAKTTKKYNLKMKALESFLGE